MTITIRQVTATAIAASTQDFTISGLASSSSYVKGAIVIWSKWDKVGDGPVAQAELGIGFSDFTNERCILSLSEDGSSTSFSNRKMATGACFDVYSSNTSSPTHRAYGTASAIADGVRLAYDDQFTDTAEAENYKITVIIFVDDGSDLKILVGDSSVDRAVDTSENVTTTGVDPDIVLCLSVCTSFVAASSGTVANGAVSFGAAIDEGGTITGSCYRMSDRNGFQTAKMASQYPPDNEWTVSNIFDTSDFAKHQVSAMGTEQFTVTQRYIAGSNDFGWMAIELGPNIKAQNVKATLPTSASTDTVLDFDTFTNAPQLLFGLTVVRDSTSATALSKNNTGDLVGFYVTDGTDEVCHAMANQDGLSTMSAETHYSASGIVVPWQSASAFVGSLSSFGSAGAATIDWSAVEGSLQPILSFFALEEDDAAAEDRAQSRLVPPPAAYRKDTRRRFA